MIWSLDFKSHRQVPNLLSLLRAVLGIALPFLILSHRPSHHIAALVIFTLASMTDYSDGWFARRYNVVSNFGKIADPTADKILILAAMLSFSRMGFYSIWWVIPILVREAAVTFCRIGWMLEGTAVGAEKMGKIKFTCQVILIFFSFAYLLALDFNVGHRVATLGYVSIHLLTVLSLALTLISGLTFFSANRINFRRPYFAKFTSGLGVGLIPVVPGTWGSLVGIGFVVLGQIDPYFYALIFFGLLWAGYWSVSRLDLSEDHDPRYVVIDEALGMMVALAGVRLSWVTVTGGFLLFRLFDVIKPFPLRRLEKLPGYWGILCDDLGAGIYAWLVIYTLF